MEKKKRKRNNLRIHITEEFEEITISVSPLGNLLEMETCEYCQRKMPIRFGVNILLRSYDYKGRIIWRCNDCAVDMINK